MCARTHTQTHTNTHIHTGNATMSRGRHLIARALSLSLSTVNYRLACAVVVSSAHCTNSAMVNCFWRPAVCNTLASNMLHAVVACSHLALPFPRQKKNTFSFVQQKINSYISRCSTYTTWSGCSVCVLVFVLHLYGRSVFGFGTTNEMCELLVVWAVVLIVRRCLKTH